MKTVVLGATGFLGRSFLRAYRGLHPDTIGTSSQPSPTHAHFDLNDPDIPSLGLRGRGYSWGLIAGGVTGVGACERERERARRINVEGTVAAAVQLVDEDVIPIFLSSDYVFDGLTGRYRECDPRRPVNEYGRFKALAEERLLERCKDNCLIVRLGKVYGLDAGDGTLLDDMARTLLRGDTLRAAVDQVFCPTFVGNVVEAVTAAQKTRTCGLVNFCAPDAWSRYDIACALADALGISRATVTPVSLDDLKEPFRRPKNTSMESTRPPLLERCMSIPDAVRIYAARIPKG